jgi:toxin FitB
MILLDTNVVSEAMKPEPNLTVRGWFDAQVSQTLYISSITIAEIMFGIGVLPEGKRKSMLQQVFEGLVSMFADRILPFDEKSARHYSSLAIKARAAGKGFPTPDGYIAAIASANGFIVASRDASAFLAAGIGFVNPWKSEK